MRESRCPLSVIRYPSSVICNPFTVYRPSHHMTNEAFTHGQRLHGERTTVIISMKFLKLSTPPAAGSDHTREEKSHPW